MAEPGIASLVYYPVRLHLQPLYAPLGYRCGDLPEAERCADEVLSLPIYPELGAEQFKRIADSLASAVLG